MSSTTTDAPRTIANGITPDSCQLAYRLGHETYTLSYPRTEIGVVRALLAVQHWLDADCNFDRRACDEVCAVIDEMADSCCGGQEPCTDF